MTSLSTLLFEGPLDKAPPENAALVTTALHALGFVDAARTARLFAGCARGEAEKAALLAIGDELLHSLSQSAEPLRALLNFSNLCDRVPEKSAFFQRLGSNGPALKRLTRLLSWSQALSDALIRQPERLKSIFEEVQPLSRPALRKQAAQCATLDELRSFRKDQFLRIGLLDLNRDTWRDARDFRLVTGQISDLAQVIIERALALIAPDSSDFCVILMGKGGARELNYSSDVDLIFLSQREDGAQIGQKLLGELGAPTAYGQLWRADMRLRPDGNSGPLVTPFAYALSYYESYAAAWEWQALIKARVVAGDAKLGRRFRRFTRQITWARRPDDQHLREVFEMKKRSEKTADGVDKRNVKSGPGGIRDAEWVVQQLQMMIGPTHPRARAKASLDALEVLEELDSLSPDEARGLRNGYLWHRVVEHRLQLWNEQAIRQIPENIDEKAALARRLGCPWRGHAAARWFDEEHEHHRRDIRALCERLFWAFFAGEELESIENSLPPHQRDATSLARLERLVNGTPTRPLPAPLARQIRAVLPGALRGLDRAANPEKALVAFENLCEASGNRLSLLRSLDASPRLGDAIWTILGGSQILADTLVRTPELLDLAANRALLERGKSPEEARSDCRAYCLTFRDRKAAMRRWRGRELLRIGLRDLVMETDPHEITAEIAALAGACLDLALDAVRDSLRPASNSMAFALIGLGKFGGSEMHYASDCDVMFLYSLVHSSPVQSALAVRWAEEMISFCGERTEDGPGWKLDARLRPHGSSGVLASSLDALSDYLENPASSFAIWERQALTRARFACGDGITGARAMAMLRDAAHPAQWQKGWSEELKHIKGRVENERAAKGAFAKSAFVKASSVYDVKLGAGSLSDIEWCAQWLALQHGAQFPALATPNTRRQLAAAHDGGFLSESEWQTLENAYRWLRRAELRLQIAREGGASAPERDSKDARIWARVTFPTLGTEEALERFDREWEEHTRAARAVFERVRETL